MGKTILYKLFKLGGIPNKVRPVLEAEGLVLYDEGIGGWIVTRKFKAPGKRFRHRWKSFSGFLAITEKRVISYGYFHPQINVPVDDPRLSSLHTELVGEQKLSISFETSLFHSDWQGVIELRFNTPKAREFHQRLLGLGLRPGSAAEASGRA